MTWETGIKEAQVEPAPPWLLEEQVLSLPGVGNFNKERTVHTD